MINTIAAKFNEIVYRCLERFAKKEGIPIAETQLLFSLSHVMDPKGTVVYHLMKEYSKYTELTFLQVLDVRIDFRGYSMFVPPFIQEKIEAYALELNAQPTDITIMCVPTADESIALCLYNKKEFVKQILLSEEF